MNADEANASFDGNVDVDHGEEEGAEVGDGEDSAVELPILEYGYRDVPMEWSELGDIIRSGELARLTRNVNQQRRYETFKRNLRRHWKSLYDYILVDKFGFDREADSDTGLLRAKPPASTDGPHADDEGTTTRTTPPHSQVRLVKNDFPYNTAEGVEHWILWKLGTAPSPAGSGEGVAVDEGAPQHCDITPEEVATAQDELRHRLGDVTDFLHWINPPHLKTVPELDHVHVLCLRSSDAAESVKNDEELYRTAVDALYSPLHQSTSASAIRDATRRRSRTVDEMRAYLDRIGLDAVAACPPCIHITGTKGKGSTAAMCESIMRQRYGLNTGLFTSPHLLDIRERIRIMGRPVSSRVFGRVYWHLRKKLECYRKSSPDGNDDDLPALPGYFRMLTLMALYIFAHHQDPAVDVMIVEVGMGGRYDATNVVTSPKVCGIALIDYDHVDILGDTLEKIAQEKVGIYTGREQAGEFCNVLDTNAPSPVRVITDSVAALGGRVKLVGRQNHPVVPLSANLGLAGRHQRDNVELAIALCREAVQRFPQLAQCDRVVSTNSLDDSPLLDALSNVSWPGRCQLVQSDSLTLCLDGAHTVESLAMGRDWFQQHKQERKQPKVLIFTCSHERNPVELLGTLCNTEFALVVFARADSERPSATAKPSADSILTASHITYNPELQVGGEGRAETWQDSLATVWKHLVLNARTKLDLPLAGNAQAVLSCTSVKDALDAIRQWSDKSSLEAGVSVLVTGSLYLVGSVLNAIGWHEDSATGSVRIA